MIVVDFDETLIKVNSFPLWVKYLMKVSIHSFNVRIFFKVFYLSLKRKIRILSHREYKALLCLIEIPLRWQEEFALSMSMKVNIELLKRLRIKEKIIVATAAPRVYAEKLANCIFDGKEIVVIASEWRNDKFIDNVGLRKLQSIFELFPEEEINCFYTDHEDDLPTMCYSKEVFLVGDRLLSTDPSFKNINIKGVIRWV